jgi:SagB-type dehydrogenase family enzyme
MAKQSILLLSALDNPRRIELRQAEFIKAYERRDTTDDIIEVGHDLTKLRRSNVTRIREAVSVFQQPSALESQFAQDRAYPLQPRVRLPQAVIPDCPFGDLLRARRSVRRFARKPLGLSTLGSLLFGAIGETGRTEVGGSEDNPVTVSLRAIPSGGGLHPTAIFATILQDGELARGVYHYDVPEHSLEFVKALGEEDTERLFGAVPMHPYIVDLTRASAIFFISSKFWRSRAKYGPRGYRHCLLEAGAAYQNMGLTAVALGLGHLVLGGFYDDEVNAFLEIDGIDHAVIIAVAVGALCSESEEELQNVEY